ncbi:MAG: 16S rRNA (guanine(527)-N(7))-methyltransferase RsmG [Bacteroidota bacterium]
MEIIEKYFPGITVAQHAQFSALYDLYVEWNAQINVISRKDIENLFERHVLHSLAIAKWIDFMPEASILDLGCGGGFPGVPLAIMYPESHFHLVDSIAKKLKVVDAIAEAIGLTNVNTTHSRAESLPHSYDFVVTRAVANIEQLLVWIRKLVSHEQMHPVPNGLIALKGGHIYDETRKARKQEYMEIEPLSQWFDEPFFEEKFLVYVQQ